MTRRERQGRSLETSFPRKYVPVKADGDSEAERGLAYAELVNSPELAAYRVIGMMQPKELSKDVDVPSLLAVLKNGASEIGRGDLSGAESMLINQAYALQALFVRLSERAMEQTHMPNLEAFMRLALRSQSQCRSTLEALSAIKNPPVVYARQANVTTGPQQINNGIEASPRVRETTNPPNQLSGASHEL